MSAITKFIPQFTAGQQRYHVNSTNTITGYLKCDGSVVAQATYPKLYSQIGLIIDGNVNGTWSAGTPVSTTDIACVTYGNGIYVYGGGNSGGAILASSTDGITWTSRTTGRTNQTIYAATYGNGLFAVGNQYIYTSTNGATWTERSLGVSGSPNVSALAYGNGTYVYTASPGGTTQWLGTSTDAITWTARSDITTSQMRAITYGNGQFVIAGNGGKIYYSSNPASGGWSNGVSGTTTAINALIYGNGLFVYAGGNGILATSTDASTWTSRTSGQGTTNINGLSYNSNLYIAVLDGGKIITSTDAITWTLRTSGTTTVLYSVAYGNGKFVAGGGISGTDGVVRVATQFTYDSTTNFLLPTTSTILSTTLNSPQAYIKTS